MGCCHLNLNPIHCITRNPWSCIVCWLFFGVERNNARKLLQYFTIPLFNYELPQWVIQSSSIKDWLTDYSFSTTKFVSQTLLLCSLLVSPSVSHGWPNFEPCPRSHQHWMLSNFCPSGHRSHPRMNQLKWYSTVNTLITHVLDNP